MKSSFAEVGFESTDVLNNMGTMFLFYIGYLFLMPLRRMLGKCKDCSPRVSSLNWRLKHYLYYGSLITGLFQGFVVLAISVLIGIYKLNFDSFGDKVQSCAAIFFAFFLVAAPCVLIWKTAKNFDNLKDYRFKS